jgi:hypothetical protein
MGRSYWKTLKTVENLAEKPDLTLGTCLNLAKLSFGACPNLFWGCDQIGKLSKQSKIWQKNLT